MSPPWYPLPNIPSTTGAGGTHPADGQEEVELVGFGDVVPQLPVDEVLPGEDQQAEPHGHQQHVEDAGHVVDVQLAAHHLQLVVVADPRQPQPLQHLQLVCGGRGEGVSREYRERIAIGVR